MPKNNPLDEVTFRAVGLARHAVTASPTHPAVLNAANEECVAAFLAGRIGFLDIARIVGDCVEEHLAHGHVANDALTVDAVLVADAWGRARAAELAGVAA